MLDTLITLQRSWLYPKFRLISPFVPANGTRRARVYGAWFDLDLSDRIQRSVYIGSYERDETMIFKRLLSAGGTLVDVGANIGYFTALGAHQVGATGRVISVEPNPSAYGKLHKMVTDSGLSQCRPFNVGLSDEPGTLTLFEPPAAEHNLNSTMVQVEGYKPIQVRVRTLDDLLEELQVEQVDLLKCDVEGHEPKVFAGGTKALVSGKVRHIVCEFNRYWLTQAGNSPEKLLEQLKGYGFEVIPGAGSEADLPSSPLQNLVFRHRSARG